MRLFVVAMAVTGCTSTNFQMQAPADLAELPDMAEADQAAAPDLTTAADLAGVDFSGSDLLQLPDLAKPSDLAKPPSDMAHCGGEGEPCCGGVTMGPGNTYCGAPPPALNCWESTCQQCGGFHQPCCGGAVSTGMNAHMGGTCYSGTCKLSGAFPSYYCQ